MGTASNCHVEQPKGSRWPTDRPALRQLATEADLQQLTAVYSLLPFLNIHVAACVSGILAVSACMHACMPACLCDSVSLPVCVRDVARVFFIGNFCSLTLAWLTICSAVCLVVAQHLFLSSCSSVCRYVCLSLCLHRIQI